MKLQTEGYPLAVSSDLMTVLERYLSEADCDLSNGVVINFRDPNYDPDSGGFHPVEIAIDAHGRLLYLTDFAYLGSDWDVELAKELDFDFTCGLFQQFGIEYPIAAGRELFALWQQNFCSYVAMNIFQVTVSPL